MKTKLKVISQSDVDTIGTLTESPEQMDREILYCAVLSAEYFTEIKDLIKPGIINKWSSITWKFLTDYYIEYAKHPQDIHTYFKLRKGKLNQTHAELVEKLFKEVAAEYPEGREVDVPVMVEETIKYCEMRKIVLAANQAIDLAQGGDNKAAKSEFEKALKPSVIDQIQIASTNPIPLWPSEVMSGAAGRFAKCYAQYLETPESFLFMNHLTLLGHVVSGKISLLSELRPQPRFYTCNLGESADTRKSTSIIKATEFFEDVLPDNHFIHGVGSAEGLAKALESNEKAVLVCDELNSLIQKMRIDGSVLLPCLCSLFESNRFHNHTKKSEIKIDGAELCLLGASTLDTYRSMFNSRFMSIGFINRIFVLVGDSAKKFSVPEPMPDTEYNNLKKDLLDLMAFVEELTTRDSVAGSCYFYPMDKDAKELFHSWYINQESSIFTKRLDAYGHRLMPLLALNEMKEVIDLEIVQKTITLLDYELKARKFADPVDADNSVAALEEKIRRLLSNGPLPKRVLENSGNKARVGTWLWETALKNLKVETHPYKRSVAYKLPDEN